MEPNRTGSVTEYKRGHYYLSHTKWADGHCEIEVHHCCPRILWHSCDPKEWESAKSFFENLEIMEGPPPVLPELADMYRSVVAKPQDPQ